MIKPATKFVIVIADDDEDDQMMTASAFKDAGAEEPVVAVSNGEDLLNYLLKQDKYAGATHDLPGLVLLDLNMPKIDGRVALKEIRKNPAISKIPIVVFSTSTNREDITTSYANGANSFISKPSSYNDLVNMAKVIKEYWGKIVAQP
ncbi:MAG TPA: response regulator [Flavobacteriales bacterium]|nr:response regulator [Flavobacteriales bacterium]